MRNHGAGGTSHSRRDALVDAGCRLAENKTLPGVGEEDDHVRKKRKVGQRPISHILNFLLDHGDGSHFFGTHVVEIAHGLKGFAQLG